MKHHIFILALSFILLASCEKVIDVDPNAVNSKMVLNGIPSVNKDIFVYFAHSRFFLDTSNNHPANDVDMVVTINGTQYRPVKDSNCLYFFDYNVQEGDSLQISISAEGKQITAATRAPRMPQIDLNAAYVNSDTSINLLMVNFTINDPGDYHNLYCFRLTERDSGAYYHPYWEFFDTIDTVYTNMFFCYDDALTASNAAASEMLYGYPVYTQLLTSDANINGTSHNTTLFMMLPRDTNEIQPFIHQYSLTVECVSPERYKYLQTVAAANNMMSLITEPPEVYSNINGALGIFCGTAKQTFPLITLADGEPINVTNTRASTIGKRSFSLPTVTVPREVVRRITQNLRK